MRVEDKRPAAQTLKAGDLKPGDVARRDSEKGRLFVVLNMSGLKVSGLNHDGYVWVHYLDNDTFDGVTKEAPVVRAEAEVHVK